MKNKSNSSLLPFNELIFQVALHALVFVFYAFERQEPHFPAYNFVFFLNYAVAAFIINYFLLPRFFYRKQYLPFFGIVVVLLASVIILEEFVLEVIYFPDTRATGFPGIFFTLSQVLPVIVILSGFKFAWDALVKQREVEALEEAVRESELQFLKSQINPHFLFNNLNNLYAYSIENSPKTPEIILELSGLLRYMLYECKEQYVPLTKEMDQLKNFVNLNEMQIEERGNVKFETRGIKAGFPIAPLILIVFIENAFKHSTASQSEDINIDVHVELDERGILNFVCKNSFQQQSNVESLANGIGLENVKKRLEMLYPDAHELNISEGENLYEVQLTMDLNKTV